MVALVLGLGLALSSANAAGAHAILLSSEPGPQTTTATSPSLVRLHFSEAVEVAFGAIRVYDVNGHRKDSGSLRRTDQQREVDVPVTRLANGTYTVTWRVTSSDGHVVGGGFAFYVGAPSSISAFAPTGTGGPSSLMNTGFGVTRFVWLASFLGLVGLVVFRRWIWTPAIRAADLADSEAAGRFRTLFRPMLIGCWVALTVTGLLGLVFQTAALAGLSLSSAARPSLVREALHTDSGRLWLWQFVLAALMAPAVWALVRRRRPIGGPAPWLGGLGVLVVGSSVVAAMNGHARTFPAPGLVTASVALHLLAVAVWTGGLATLAIAGGLAWRRLPTDRRPDLMRELLPRFSRAAILSVIGLIYTGTIVALIEVGPLSDLWHIRWGQVLLGKIALLAIALALGARHLWLIPRRLARPDTSARAVRSFGRSSVAETVAVFGAVALAAALVALIPGRSLLAAKDGPVNQEQKAGRDTVQLLVDPAETGSNQLHVTFVTDQGFGAGDVQNITVSLTDPGGKSTPMSLRLIAPGHFVGEPAFSSTGAYRLAVSSPKPKESASFSFRIRSPSP